MFENITKDERNRYLTIAVILLFVFSTIAIYISTPANSGNGTPTPTPGGNANATLTFTGRGSANATLMRWDPALFVRGPDPRLNGLLANLSASGIVIKDVPQAGGHILTLSDSAQILNVTEQLVVLNVTIQGNGVISIPSAFVQGDSINRTVSGGTFYYQDTPQFAEGDVFPIAFDAYVQGTALQYGPQNILVLPGNILDAEVAPLSVRINQTFLQTFLPWGERNLDLGQYQINLIGGDQVRPHIHSVVYFQQLLSDSQLASLNAQLPAWAAAAAEDSLIGVKVNVTNQTLIQTDLARFGITPIFPSSSIEVYPYATGRNWSSIVNDTARIWNETYPNITAQFTNGYKLQVTLRPTLSLNGQTYAVRTPSLLIQSNYPPMDNGTLKVSFQPQGRQIVTFTTASYSPAGMIEPIQ